MAVFEWVGSVRRRIVGVLRPRERSDLDRGDADRRDEIGRSVGVMNPEQAHRTPHRMPHNSVCEPSDQHVRPASSSRSSAITRAASREEIPRNLR